MRAWGLRIDGELLDWSSTEDGALDMIGTRVEEECKRRLPKLRLPNGGIKAPVTMTVELVECAVVAKPTKSGR